MRRRRDLVAGITLCLVGVLGLAVLGGARWSMGGAGMMGMGGMMDRGGMKSMMQGMMGGQLPTGIDPEDLPDPGSPGARLLVRYCAQCHDLPSPGLHTANEWPVVIARMDRRMRMMGGGMMMGVGSPSRKESGKILAYLQRHALKPADPARQEGLDTPEGRAFREVCSGCHVLPDPGQHTAAEWPEVVVRMKRNMAAMGKEAPDEDVLLGIVGYLKEHAGRP